MPVEVFTSQLEAEIKKIYMADPVDAERRIESHLNSCLKFTPLAQRIGLLKQVASQLDSVESQVMPQSKARKDILADLSLLFLGEKASGMEIGSEKQMEHLADALNTIFDSLNELIDVINTTLKGTSSQQETIRGLIGMRMSNEEAGVSLGAHLGQIKQAFLLSREASMDAARSIVLEILTELDPERMENEQKRPRLGPFRKAELLAGLKEKHKRCRQWFESDRFDLKLIREFEKHCSNHFGVD
jgi:hypothetical protein